MRSSGEDKIFYFCPCCGVELDVLDVLHRGRGGRKAAAARENGKKGGRPKKAAQTAPSVPLDVNKAQ